MSWQVVLLIIVSIAAVAAVVGFGIAYGIQKTKRMRAEAKTAETQAKLEAADRIIKRLCEVIRVGGLTDEQALGELLGLLDGLYPDGGKHPGG